MEAQYAYTFATPYGLRGWNGVDSSWGSTVPLPNISLEAAWYTRAFGASDRTASRTRTAPSPVISPVRTGCTNEVATKDCAARLYTSSGSASRTARLREVWAIRSPSMRVGSSAL